MMMGIGLLFMLVVGLVVIGIPVLIIVSIAGGGLAKLFRPQTPEPGHYPALHKTTVERKCPTCGRAVKQDWNICPSCGAALT